jgi:hypothetical protein
MNNQRNGEIYERYRDGTGETMSELGKRFKLTRMGIYLILKNEYNSRGSTLVFGPRTFRRTIKSNPKSPYLNSENLPSDLVRRFKQHCNKTNMTVNHQLAILIENFLERKTNV